MKLVPLVSFLVLGFAPLAYAADAPVKTEPAPATATEPTKVSPELMREISALGAMQTRMNALLTQRQALDAQIKAQQQQIDDATAMKDKLSK